MRRLRIVWIGLACFLGTGSSRAADPRPVVAVFDVELDKRIKLPKTMLDGLPDYIASRLTESGRYLVIPRDQIKQRLVGEKTRSYSACFDQSCQIEIGKELAAEKTLAVKIIKLGKRCALSLTFYDLRLATTAAAATQHGGCGEDEVVDSLDKALTKLTTDPGRPAPDSSALEWVMSPQAAVEFTRSEVTVAQYRACTQAGKCSQPRPNSKEKTCNWGLADRDGHPLNCVDWRQATAFCGWAGGRLPSEPEWQAEASAAGRRAYPWGDQAPSCERAVFKESWKQEVKEGCGRESTWPVCSKPAGNSASGLCDMAGNLMEWTSSLYQNSKTRRVVRGGSWRDVNPDALRADYSNYGGPGSRADFYGFRCARTPR